MNEERRTKNEEQAALHAAFTLIELLIVILVIAILAAMLFPVILKAKTWAKEKQAAIEVKNIDIAIRAYRSVYGKWPGQTPSAIDTCYVADNSSVITALITNPRRMVFLQFQKSSICTNTGSYLDPWRHPYVIVMDYSCDNQVRFNTGGVILTNLNTRVTTNTMDFLAEFPVGVISWGDRDDPLNVAQANFMDMDLCSWQMAPMTK
ncbi:MAG: type II secretion system GspH family protein [Verrucomicrobia bacterium]|nr:type II secretion system GspH family protein [Verrucomicrobiota bacterium]MCG2678413.1 type II secretion system GspH family protein [Kiritimatiellia bacterium]MBU4247830.1 type II secretion system GspH family protein [Verrucomicrobiota bacterium]MBU4291960.1 type II secretion system GspH family protein [Verrucomicrobiota bacterium]MBU4429844.1 type II secretion system GspH family protein [Verrucomicrobiota bacterium]